jgi:hypothetical protein
MTRPAVERVLGGTFHMGIGRRRGGAEEVWKGGRGRGLLRERGTRAVVLKLCFPACRTGCDGGTRGAGEE